MVHLIQSVNYRKWSNGCKNSLEVIWKPKAMTQSVFYAE